MWALPLLLALGAPLAVNAVLYAARHRVLPRLPVCDDDDEDTLPARFLALSFVAECGAGLLAVLFSAVAPLLSVGVGDPSAARVRVVLLHGLGQTRGAVEVLARRLRRLGYEVVFFSWAGWRVDIAGDAERLRRRLIELQDERPGPVCLVAFGVGGLVARYCVCRHRAAGVRRLVTLGTPHQGTLVAPPGSFLGLGALRPSSALLTRLAAADRTPQPLDSTAVQSAFDAVVLPPDNGYYPAAFNVIVRDVGHFSLLFSRRIFQLLAENLA